jgi:hypothetical protein
MLSLASPSQTDMGGIRLLIEASGDQTLCLCFW